MQTRSPTPGLGSAPAGPRFDTRVLEHQPIIPRILAFLSQYPQRWLTVLRWFTPVFRCPFFPDTVLRHDDVRAVLSDSRAFPVPWGWKMALVTRDDELAARDPGRGSGRNFVLGMKEPDEAYRQDYALLAQAFPYEETGRLVPQRAREATVAVFEALDPDGRGGTFDLVEQLVLGVPARMCDNYYGIVVDDPIHFGHCTLAVSSFLFGLDFEPPTGGSALRSQNLALQAAAPLRHAIRGAMDAERAAIAAGAAGGGAPTPLRRLIAPKAGMPAADDDRIHVQLFGMVMGFIPTNVLAAGNILETLLRHPDQLAHAVAAADAGDDERLWRCLRETLRFRNINLGPLRVCAEDREFGEPGCRKRIRAGAKVLACTQSAMFDRRRIDDPHRYSSARADEDYLVFGVGQHWCVGAYIAIAQITQMFKLLLTRYRIAPAPGRAGRMQRWQVFPLHMAVQLTPRRGAA